MNRNHQVFRQISGTFASLKFIRLQVLRMEENLPAQETNDINRIIPVNIEEQMKTAYIDYSMSVIVGRALPDVRDGLKPVHRRILHAMNDMGMYHNRPFKKSARIVVRYWVNTILMAIHLCMMPWYVWPRNGTSGIR
jgi:hypothetical protein